ncbi:MAG: aminopeptidase [Planctomycetota bacterium]
MADVTRFEDRLENYARLIVEHGLNVQEGQVVNITAEAIHRDFAMRIVERAYRRGARFVDLNLVDARSGRMRLLESKEADLSFVPAYTTERAREMVDDHGANLRLLGSENPDILSDLDPRRVNQVRLATFKALKYFYDEGIGRSKVHWTVAAAATPAWGRKLFPELDGETACARLWDAILRACRADRSDCLEVWQEHNARLQARARRLTALGIRELHFTGGGTDLVVGLSAKARFAGGTDLSPRKVPFEPNLPTEEVFTTPDCRATRGTVRATRPFLINGKLIEGLELRFEAGEIVHFAAASGEATFREYISSDAGARRLGEVALVGIDSPIYQSGLVFQEILFDENAACHIAVGSAYKFCLEGGTSMSPEELVEQGCNESSVHTDMMISSEEVDVVARTYAGTEVPLLRNGEWVFE